MTHFHLVEINTNLKKQCYYILESKEVISNGILSLFFFLLNIEL